MRIRIIGNDIEVYGIKVARILDINRSLREDFESLIEKLDSVDDNKISEQKEIDKKIQEAYTFGKVDGYAEGRDDGQG